MASKNLLPVGIDTNDIKTYICCIQCHEFRIKSKILLCAHIICVACLADIGKNHVKCSVCNVVTSFPDKSAMPLQNNFLAEHCLKILEDKTEKPIELIPNQQLNARIKSPHVLLLKSHKYVEYCHEVTRQTSELQKSISKLYNELLGNLSENPKISIEEKDRKKQIIFNEFKKHSKAVEIPHQTANFTIKRILQISKLLQIGKELRLDPKSYLIEEAKLKEKLNHAFNQVELLRTSLTSIKNFYQVKLKTPEEVLSDLNEGAEFHLFGTEARICQKIGGEDYLSNPIDVAVSDSMLYVLDWKRVQIVVFNFTGEFICTFGSKGENKGQFMIPHNILVTSESVLVTDWYQNNIQVFTKQGNFLSKFGCYGREISEFDAPSGMAMEKRLLFIADYLNNRVQVFIQKTNAEFVFRALIGADNLRGPMDVAIPNRSQDLIILDDSNPCVHIYSQNGDLKKEFCNRMGIDSFVIFPWFIAIDCKDNILLSDRDGHKVCVFNSEGEFQEYFSSKDALKWHFKDPAGIAASKCDIIFICDCYNSCVQAYKSSDN